MTDAQFGMFVLGANAHHAHRISLDRVRARAQTHSTSPCSSLIDQTLYILCTLHMVYAEHALA